LIGYRVGEKIVKMCENMILRELITEFVPYVMNVIPMNVKLIKSE